MFFTKGERLQREYNQLKPGMEISSFGTDKEITRKRPSFYGITNHLHGIRVVGTNVCDEFCPTDLIFDAFPSIGTPM